MDDKITSNLIIASAGTGKTYQLTSRFVTLMALGVEPERMIALTFTNKAAGEFRNRIFQAVAEGAQGKKAPGCPKRNILAARIWETLTGVGIQEDGSLLPKENAVPLYPPSLAMQKQAVEEGLFPEEKPWPLFRGRTMDAAFFCEMLEKLVDKSSQLHLSTLDSFFGTVVAVSDRMSSPLNAVVPLSEAKLRAAQMEVLHEFLLPQHATDDERNAFDSLYRDIAGDNGKSVLHRLHDCIEGYLSFFHRHTEPLAWGRADALGLPDCSGEPPLEADEWEAVSAEIARQVAALTWKGIKGSSQRFRVKDSLLNLVDTMRDGSFALHKAKSLPGWLRKEEKYLPLPSEERCDDELRTLVGQLYERYRRLLLQKLQKKTAGMYCLLARYETLYLELVLGSGRASFDDVTRVATNILTGASPQLSLWLHSRLDHWMLDEFQDTNPEQWHAIRNLLEENASDGSGSKSLFVVGDKKQSIYGFRGAAPVLFDMLRGKIALPGETFAWNRVLQPASLHVSRRSSPEIISFVKTLFSQIGEMEQEDFQRMATCPELAERRGYVQLSLFPPALKEEQQNTMCEQVGRILDDLAEPSQEGMCRLKGNMAVAVLTRSNGDAARIANWLGLHRPRIPVQLVSDAFVAAASPLGEMLMSFFLWLLHPGDKYRRRLLQASPLRSLFLVAGKEGQGNLPSVQQAWEQWRQTLEAEGYAAVLQRLIGMLPSLEHPRLAREWLEAAYAFDAAGGSLQDWLLEIRSLSMKSDPSPGYVQVMTIHKSKGMEFDAVILPILSGKPVDGRQDMKYVASERGTGILLAPSAQVWDAWSDELAPYGEAWGKEQRREAYNLLYVALTRAKRANYILLFKGEKGQASHSYAGIIREALEQGMPGQLQESGMQMGSPQWYEDMEAEVARQAEKRQEIQHTLPLGKAWKRLRRESPSQQEHGKSPQEKRALPHASFQASRASRQQAIELGTAIHSLFESILWLDENNLPDWCNHPGNEAETMASRALAVPSIRQLFQRASFPQGTQVYNEQALDAISGGVWVSAIIDRLYIIPGGSALILDYKTNREISQLKREYRGQLATYRQLVSEALSLSPEKVQAYLVAVGCAEPRLLMCPYGA